MPNILMHSWHPLIQLIITIPLRHRYCYYLYFTDEESETQDNPCTVSRSECGKASDPGRQWKSPNSQFPWYVCV